MEQGTPPPLERPPFRLRFKSLAILVGFVSAVVGILVFLFPLADALRDSPCLRFALGAILLLVALASPVYPWGREMVAVALGRWREYPSLRERARYLLERIQELRVMSDALFRYAVGLGKEQTGRSAEEKLPEMMAAVLSFGRSAQPERVFEIGRASYEGERVFIALRKGPGRALSAGTPLDVLHTEDGLVMGAFTVSEIRSEEYYAVGRVREVDPVWVGMLVERGEMTMLPHMIAVITEEEEPEWQRR